MKAFEKLLHIIAKRIVTIWMHPDIIFKNLPLYKVFEENKKVLYGVVDKVDILFLFIYFITTIV